MAVRDIFEQAGDNLRYLLRGPGSSSARARHSNIIPFPTATTMTEQAAHDEGYRSSWAFDSHIVSQDVFQEASGGKGPQAVSLAWDERDAWGLDLVQRSWQGLTPQDRKAILLDIYINNPWVSACIDVIVKRICSGGFTIEKVDKAAPDNQAHYDQLAQFADVSDDWDFLQYARACLADELIYGECYSEILWNKGVPCQLAKIDCLTMGFKSDRYGRITNFQQQLSSTSQVNELDINDVIRWWFPHPRASIDPFAPAEKITDAVLLSKKMVNWTTTFFQKGAKFPFYVEFPGDHDEADRYLQWFKQNHTGEKNAHLPLVAWGGAKLVPFGKGSIDIDFDKGEDKERVKVFAAFGVPPAAVAVIESGNIGGGTGEDQDKSLQYNACDPVKQQWLEKLNYRIVRKGFKIDDYRYGLRYADYRNDKDLAQVTDIRIKNGTRTPDEARQEEGKQPYDRGGGVPFVWSTKEIVPLSRLEELDDEQTQSAQLDIQTKQAQLEKLKEPTPQPIIQQQGDNPQNAQQAKNAQNAPQDANEPQGKDAKESVATSHALPHTVYGQEADSNDVTAKQPAIALHKEITQEADAAVHDGIMIAFMLDPETASKLALPGGEAASDLHVTLAYLGDIPDFTGDVEKLKETVKNFASLTETLKGVTSGVGRFNPNDDGVAPTVVLVNVHGLTAIRRSLVQSLTADGFTYAQDFAYTPHITLAYQPAYSTMPTLPDETQLSFTEMSLVFGEDRYDFPLATNTKQQQTKESDNDPVASKAVQQVWLPPDVFSTIATLKEKGAVTHTWNADATACGEICLPNDGVTVEIGKPFPMGQLTVYGHPHCGCKPVYKDAEGNVLDINGGEIREP